jgi:hypothetical protein
MPILTSTRDGEEFETQGTFNFLSTSEMLKPLIFSSFFQFPRQHPLRPQGAWHGVVFRQSLHRQDMIVRSACDFAKDFEKNQQSLGMGDEGVGTCSHNHRQGSV